MTCPGFAGYCSESYPGDTCLVVCAFGRNNVPVCQVREARPPVSTVLVCRRTGPGLMNLGVSSTSPASPSRCPGPALECPATAPWTSLAASAPSSVPGDLTSGPAVCRTVPGTHTQPVRETSGRPRTAVTPVRDHSEVGWSSVGTDG